MALYIPHDGVIYDPPAIVREAGSDLLRPRTAEIFKPEITRHRDSWASIYQPVEDYSYEIRKAVFLALPISHWGSTYVKSVQQVSVTISSGNTGTATISKVSDKAFVAYGGLNSANNSTDSSLSQIIMSLTASDTITATSGVGGTITGKCCVVDPTDAFVTSTQNLLIQMNNVTSNTGSISSASTTLTAVFHRGGLSTLTTQGVWGPKCYASTEQTDATTITARVSSANSFVESVRCHVVTFTAAVINSIQQFTTTKSTLSSNTQTITGVTLANTMLSWGGCLNNGTTFPVVPYMQITGTTTVTFTTNGTANFSSHYTVIEFKSGIVKQAQRGSIAIAAGTSGTATITATPLERTIVGWFGGTGAGTVDRTTNTNLALTATTTLTANVNTSASPTLGYEAIQIL